MSETYSVLVHLQRTVVLDAYVSVPVTEELLRQEADGSHRLHKHIAALVNFQRGNILDSIVPPNLMDYDIIFCRNLLIYFDRPTQLRALTNLKRWLRADGLMVHDMHLMQVKTPAESREPWDYYKVVETIRGEAAWTTRAETRCAQWKTS